MRPPRDSKRPDRVEQLEKDNEALREQLNKVLAENERLR
jgi:hypothetical protein